MARALEKKNVRKPRIFSSKIKTRPATELPSKYKEPRQMRIDICGLAKTLFAMLSEDRNSAKETNRDRSRLNVIPVLMRLAAFPYLPSERSFEENLIREGEMPISQMGISSSGNIRATLYNP